MPSLWVLYALGGLQVTAWFGSLAVITLHFIGLGWTALQAGLLITSAQAASGLAAIPSGRLVDRIGGRLALNVALLTSLASYICLVMVSNAAFGAVAWLAVAIGQNMFVVAAQQQLDEHADRSRGIVFARFAIALSVAQLVAPFLAALWLASRLGAQGMFLSGALLMVASLAVSSRLGHTIGSEGLNRGLEGDRLGGTDSRTPSAIVISWGVAASAITVLGYTGLVTFFFVYASQEGIPIERAGFVLTLGNLALFVPRLGIRFIGRWLSDLGVVMVGLAFTAVGFIGIAGSSGLVSLTAAVVLTGLGRGASQPASSALIASMAAKDTVGRTLAVRAAANQFAAAGAGVLFGFSAQIRALWAAFLAVGLCMLLIVAWGLLGPMRAQVARGR